MSSLLDAPPPSSGAASYVAVGGTLATYGVLALMLSLLGERAVAEASKLLPTTEMVEVELPVPPSQNAPAPAAAPAAPSPRAAARPAPAAPAPAAPQAGQVLDAKSDVVDFGDTFVAGSGDSYAGGVTDSQGTSTAAVREVAARGEGVPVVKPAAAVVDLTRAPQLSGGSHWQCPFPIEADDAGIDHAVVMLRVEVGAAGDVRSVSVLADPGHGFGREARRCASSKRWLAGLDPLGRATAATATVNVRFDR